MAPKRNAKRKRDAEIEFEDDADDGAGRGLSPDEPPSKRFREQSLSRLEDSDEDKEDPGRDSSRAFQDWAKWLENLRKEENTESKRFIARSGGKIPKQIEQVAMLIQKHENELKAQRQTIEAVIKNFVMEITKPEEPAHGPQALQNDARDAVARYRDMIECFLNMGEMLKRPTLETPTTTIQKDKQDFTQIMQCGRDHGEMVARGHLAPHTYSSPVKDKPESSGHEQTGATMFQATRKTVRDSIGSVIAEQKDVLRQLINILPLDQSRV
ncbi:hypothetical protein LQW54_007711 [Pestalotiopsis sp. IQ-011]